MKPVTLSKIVEVTGGRYVGEPSLAHTPITGVVKDSRDVTPGSLFVCFRGARADGHDYAGSAFAAGALCALCERGLDAPQGPYILVGDTGQALCRLGAYYRSLFRIPVVGVTGSVGKTTAKEMICAVLSTHYAVLKTPENLNNEIGVPLTLLSMREEHEAAVIEMGVSDFGEMSRLAAMVRPDICVMTRIGHCHLDRLGDLAGVLRAKSEVYGYMKPDGAAVVCGDDELLLGFDPGIRKITFGESARCDYRAVNIESAGTSGVTCRIVRDAGATDVSIPAFGGHLVFGALAAAAVGELLGVTGDGIRRGLLAYTPVGGRANVRETGYMTLIDDCYNANPISMSAALRSLCALEGRRVAILGDMNELGRESRRLHRELGELAARLGVDCLICCGEKAEFIFKGLISTGLKIESWHFPLKEALFHRLPSLVRQGDRVLVKASHGMHFEELVRELARL